MWNVATSWWPVLILFLVMLACLWLSFEVEGTAKVLLRTLGFGCILGGAVLTGVIIRQQRHT